jgi:acetate kinase
MRILVLNAGSSTLKATVVVPPGRDPAFDRTVPWQEPADDSSVTATVHRTLDDVPGPIDAVGYRVVHGGERFTGPTRLDDEALAAIAGLADLAPLHNPIAVQTIRAARERLPSVTHVASFDTAFHATLPEAARRYPVPAAWTAGGVRRYGFHGLSVEWSMGEAAARFGRPATELRLVVAHLGGGCSVTAVDGGRSVDTSMGLTPLEGLMMGTRAGSIDPGILFRLLRDGRPPEDLERDLDRGSGLLAIGGTADMEQLLAREEAGDPRAALAVEMFIRRAAAGIAGTATTLSQIDALVFTGGIGEHAASVRDRIRDRLRLDPETEVLVVAAREDLVIASQVAALEPAQDRPVDLTP